MFSWTKETHQLLSLTQAKEILKQLLSPRIKIYEDRLKKNWLTRSFEYLQTNYGETGYHNTKAFLASMENITNVQDLIKLTTQEQFLQGYKMGCLLRQGIIQICRFNNHHINLLADDLRKEVAEEKERYSALSLINIETRVIAIIYKKIISSKNNGQEYLQELNHRLNKTPSDKEMQVTQSTYRYDRTAIMQKLLS